MLTIHEEELYDNINVYIAPPEPSELTDEDSADEDNGGLLDNLSGRQLVSDAEIRFTNNYEKVLPSYNDTFHEEYYTSVSTTPVICGNIASDIRPTTSSCEETAYGGNVGNTELDVNIVNTSTYEKMKYNVIDALFSEKQTEMEAKKKKKKKAHLNKKTWIEGDIEAPKAIFPTADFSQYKDLSAVDLFELFFDDDLFDMIVQESNNYALFKNYRHPNITKDELKCFFGILLFTGYHTLPGKRYYWESQPDMHVSYISNAMRRNRFEQIMQFLHLADNRNVDNNDKLFKLRPLLSKLKDKYLQHFIPEQNLSYDESMIEYFGRHGCKQSIRNKPIRFGYKVWCVNTVPGYLVNFEVYQGKSRIVPTKYEHVFGKPSAVLVKLMDELPEDKSKLPFRLYFDNLFTNFYLLKYFQEIGYSASGTLREDRIPKSCPLTSKKEIKDMPRGYFEHALCKEDGILVCKWHDNGVVSLATNCHGVEPVSQVKRYSVEQKKHILVQRPAVIAEYNKHMGGVDKMDENVGRYRIAIRSKKWYWPILTWFIDISVQNAWHLRRSSGNVQPQLDFRREMVQCYLSRYGVQSKGPGRPISSKRSISLSRVSDDIRYDGMDHLVVSTPQKKKRRCAGDGCSSIMRTMCKKCDVGLCIECFSLFHSTTY